MLLIVVSSAVVLRILKRRDEQRRSTFFKGRKERSLLFENVHVAARKIAQQIKFKKCGRVNSSHAVIRLADSLFLWLPSSSLGR
jgi:hypothetical protein